MINSSLGECIEIKQEVVDIKEEIMVQCPLNEQNENAIKEEHVFKVEENKIQDESRKYKCNECDYCARYKEKLKVHIIRKHTPDHQINYYHCNKCDYKAKVQNNVEKHVINCHRPKKYKCNDCDFSSPHKTKLKAHVLCKHTPDEQINYYYCKKCDYKGKTRDLLTRHEQIHLEQLLPCDRCNYKGKTRIQLRNHLNSKHLKRNAYKCKECPFTTHLSDKYRMHVILKHTPEDQIEYFYCGHCSFKGKLKDRLRTHIKNMHLKYLLKCSTSLENKLRSPLKTRLKSRQNKETCPECFFSNDRRSNLELHIMAKHTPEELKKYFHCDLCNYKAICQKNVKRHIRKWHVSPENI